jgi:chromosome segregation ATPase
LRSKLAEADQLSAQREKDLKKLVRREADLIKETQELESKLARECKGTKLIIYQMEQLRIALFAEVEGLQTYLSTERQNLDKLKKKLSKATTKKETVLKEAETLRSQLADERQNYHGLHAELKAAIA